MSERDPQGVTGGARRPPVPPIEGAEAYLELIYEARALFHRAGRAADELHGGADGGGISAGKRGILEGLAHFGPQTVPEMARARPVSRQHIQSLVNPLVEEGLVELVDNPAHKRSKLVQLTRAGERALEALTEREACVFPALAEGFDERELRRAARALRKVRASLEGERFERIVRAAR